MQNLLNTSLFKHFSALPVKPVPQNKYNTWLIDKSLFFCFPPHLLGRDRELWLFGIGTQEELECSVISFDCLSYTKNHGKISSPLILDSWFSVDTLHDLAGANKLTAIFDISFLASLADPRPCLLALKRLMIKQDLDCFFIERPQSTCNNCRYWSAEAMEAFLRASGFQIILNQRNAEYSIFLHGRLSTSYYQDYLKKCGLGRSKAEANYLLVASQDASLEKTGGIGTYVANVKRLNLRCVILYIGNQVPAKIETGDTVIASEILGLENNKNIHEDFSLLEAIYIMLYALPRLVVCEFHDFKSIGFRLVQAKKTGCLPHKLFLRAFLHGNIDHIKYGIRTQESGTYSPSDVRIAIKDKFIFENVDEVVAPSKYILNLLRNEFEYILSNQRVQRLPFDLSLLDHPPDTQRYATPTTLVYIGKFVSFKGWPDFLNALDILAATESLKSIKEIVIISPGKLAADERRQLEVIAPCSHIYLSHSKLMRFLRDMRKRALFIIPYTHENYPYATLELLLSACRFVGYRAGGAPEVVDNDEFLAKYFTEADPYSLAIKIKEIVTMKDQSFCGRVLDIARLIWQRQEVINDEYIAPHPCVPVKSLHECNNALFDEVSVVTPVFNTPLAYLKELATSLRTSSLIPKEWILVDDGSSLEYSLSLKEFSAENLDLKTRLVRQENKGLAGARNRGLAEAQTTLAYFMDSDDVFLPHTLAHAALAMAIQPKPVLAVSGFSLHFQALDQITSSAEILKIGKYWKPLGLSAARTLSLYKNEFICASSMINLDLARKFGGWDQSDRSTWEDWSFYMKAAWMGLPLLLLPTPGYLHRKHPNSMSKTYNRYFGMRRLARSIPLLSRFESNILLGLIQYHCLPKQPKI